MLTDRFLRDRRGVSLEAGERERLEASITETKTVDARKIIARANEWLDQSTLLVEGIMSRYLDDRNGLRQLVAIHLPGDFVDLHAYPLKRLDHDVGTMTPVTIAIVPHVELDAITAEMPELTRKLWYATLLDAAIHRAWLFRLGRLDAIGRVAHFFCETDVRLQSAGLSDGREFMLGLTQADVAEICGLTTVHVNRVVRHLREQRLCIFRNGKVEILDPVKLARRAQFDPAYLYIEGPDADMPQEKLRR